MVLKPSAHFRPRFNPHDRATYHDVVDGVDITVKVIGARHLSKAKGTLRSFVEIGVLGIESDTQHFRTKVIAENGFNPVWNEEYNMKIGFPEVACLRFVVSDEDMFGEPVPIAVAVLPFGTKAEPTMRSGKLQCIESLCVIFMLAGLRSIQLKNIYGENLELATLLVHVQIVYMRTERVDELQTVRDEIFRLTADRDELAKTILRTTQKKAPIDAAV